MTNVGSYTDEQLLKRVKGLPSYKSLPSGYWILGVRSNEDAADKYDDKFYLFEGEKFITVTTGTTNPGKPILTGGFIKYNKEGAAVVKSDSWYYDIWSYGKHLNRMPALLQVGGPITVYRDGDKDDKAEEQGETETGYFGINFHAATWDEKFKGKQENIGGWSAGCQVVNDKQKHLEIVTLIKKQKKISYVLIKEFEA